MASLTSASRAAARSATARFHPRTTTAARTLSTTPAHLEAATSSSYESPFLKGEPKTTKVPDFSKYMSGGQNKNLVFQYFMVGTMGAITAAGAKSTIQGEFCADEECLGLGVAGFLAKMEDRKKWELRGRLLN
jgi:ubiquinol-cytochrome c reductase iron-sulfur subunit